MSSMDWAEAANKRRPSKKRAVKKESEPLRDLTLSLRPAAQAAKIRPSSALRAQQNQMQRAETRGIRTVKAENPHCKGLMEPVQKRVVDPIERLFSQGKIDDAQRGAAHKIRRAVEAMGEGVGSVDPARVRVDCAGKGDPAPRMLTGAEFLNQVRALLGRRSYEIVRRIAGRGETLTEVARDFVMTAQELAHGGVGQDTRNYVSRDLRHSLREVAEEFGG